MFTDKEIEHIRSLKKKHGNAFLRNYDKNWDCPEENYEVYEEASSEEPCEVIETENDAPLKKSMNLDNITVTLSYMQDIKVRLSQIGKQKELLLEQVNDIDAEINQLRNEYSELKSEIIEAL